mgnify:FL=1|jgi:TusA-related sulfurtransferase
MKNIQKKKNTLFIDITKEVCPLTFVKTKLALESLGDGEILEVRLKGKEPLENVSLSAKEHGHTILSQKPEALDQPAFEPHRLFIKKQL